MRRAHSTLSHAKRDATEIIALVCVDEMFADERRVHICSYNALSVPSELIKSPIASCSLETGQTVYK